MVTVNELPAIRHGDTGPVARPAMGGLSVLARAGLAIVGALGVTLGLFIMMQSMVAGADAVLDEAERPRVIDFVRLKRTPELSVKKRQLPQRKKPQVRPATPAVDVSASRPNDAVAKPLATFARPTANYDVSLAGGTGPRLDAAPRSDADIVPLVRVQPLYPRRAAQRGLEGWVTVQFDVNASGRVRNPVVVSAEPPNVFDREALRAIRKWKYRPKVEDGETVERRGIRVRLSFNLESGV